MLQGPTMPRKVKFKCQDGSHAPCCSSEVPEHSPASADAHLEALLPADTGGVFLLQRAANQLASPKVVSIKVQQFPAQICKLRFWSRDPSGNRDQKDRTEAEIVSLLRHSCYPREILVCGCKDTLVLLAGHFPQFSWNSGG